MRVILFAYHDIGCEGLRALRAMRHDIAAVFTHADDAKENVWFGSVRKLAEELKVPVHIDADLDDPEWIKKIKAMKPDAIFSLYYRKMIRDCILAIPPKGAYNLHGSLLPKFRGRAPVNWVIVKGEKVTGLTLHHMVAKPDAGDIVAQKKVAIADNDTALTLYRKLVPLVWPILEETVPLIEKGTAPRIAQDAGQASYFGGRKPDDGKIDWSATAVQVHNLVRAVTHPYPGAFSYLNGKKFFVWKGEPQTMSGGKVHGAVLCLSPLIVCCGQGAYKIDTAQSEGGKEHSGRDWAKKNAVKIGTMLGS